MTGHDGGVASPTIVERAREMCEATRQFLTDDGIWRGDAVVIVLERSLRECCLPEDER